MFSNPAHTFLHYLRQLKKTLRIIEGHDEGLLEILQKQLHKDMLPFIAQVRTAVNFSLRTCCPLVRRENISYENSDASFQGLHRHIDLTLGYLETLTGEDFKQAPVIVHDKPDAWISTCQLRSL